MALIKFELKEDHIKLLKRLNWSMKSDHIISKWGDNEEYGDSPFGGDDLIEDMCIILNGRPSDFNPLDDEQLVSEVSDEEKSRLLELFNELPTALDIILYNSSFELGHYKSKWYDRDWIKYEPKIKLV